MGVEEEVLRRVTPGQEEVARLQGAVEALRAAVARRAAEIGADVTPMLVGSVARGTYLTNPEIDMFVAFPPTTPRETLEELGLRLGDVLEDPHRMYAEHPYTRGRFQGFEVEVVPCYRLERPADRMTAVDRTPFHNRYLLERLDDRLRAEVRLLKQFAKGVGVYGAESRVQGFSGYLCELLVLHLGGFRGVLQAAVGWHPGVVLEPEVKAARSFPEPLVVVDPVDPKRNVASAVSLDQLATFVQASRDYLRAPSLEFFFPPPPRPPSRTQLAKRLRSRGTEILAVTFAVPRISEDVLFPQARKARATMVEFLERQGFRVMASRANLREGEVLVLLELEVARLPRARQHWGPPPWLRNAEDFLGKWAGRPEVLEGPYIQEGRLVFDVARGHTSAADLLRAEIPRLSLGKNIDEAARQGFRVLAGAEALEAHGRAVAEFIGRGFPWRRPTKRSG